MVRILVFIQGTITDRGNLPSPGSVAKVDSWSRDGAEMLYLSSNKKSEKVREDEAWLMRHGFPKGQVHYRREGDEYWNVAERLQPDIIVEDNCRSIGGAPEMTYPNMRDESKNRTKSVIVEEFEGLEHLPGKTSELFRFEGSVGYER